MAEAERGHRARQYRTVLDGVEAVSLHSLRAFPRHTHDAFGLGVIVAGGHRSWSGIGTVEAGAGDVITVNPGEMHDGRPIGGPRRWRMVYCSPARVAHDAGLLVVGEAELSRPVLTDSELAAALAALFAALTQEPPDPLAAEAMLLRTLALAFTRHGARRLVRAHVPAAVSPALRRLDEAPQIPVTLAELADLCGCDRFALLRGFKRAVGTTPQAYRLQRRVTLARALLAAGSRPAEAALAAGFADQSHLTRAFARQFGVTPGRFRAARV